MTAPRALSEVVRDVALYQADLLVGRDPGAVPMGEDGQPMTRRAARTFFGWEVPPLRACALI